MMFLSFKKLRKSSAACISIALPGSLSIVCATLCNLFKIAQGCVLITYILYPEEGTCGVERNSFFSGKHAVQFKLNYSGT